ncbi:hypothetical protein CDIK_4172 [Cucumispora dikerogammari]|nr:hypothetical protein CDIK_4172 [Cucumispora dikerogammari]
MVYHKIQEKAVNREDFKIALKKINEACLRSGKLSSIVLIDNALIHHYRELCEDIEVAAYNIRYLPPYLPFLNSIENVFSVWKNNVIRSNSCTEAQLRTSIFANFSRIASEHRGHFTGRCLVI